MDKITVGTAQNVTIEYEIAGIGERMLATLLDYLIIFGYYLVIFFSMTLGLIKDTYLPENSIMLIFSIPIMFYNLLCEIFLGGQSFGKKLRKIKVVKVDGSEAGLGSYLLRWLFRIIEVVPYGIIGTIAIVMNKKGQRLGDMAAGTTVIKLRDSGVLKPLTISEVDENYIPTFAEAMQLSDKDASLIYQSLQNKKDENYHHLLGVLSQKVKSHLQIETKKYHEDFLTTLLKDYNYYHKSKGGL